MQIKAVIPDSVAASADIREGDRVLSFDGEMIGEVFDLVYAVQQKKPGDRGQLLLSRDGEEKKLEVTFRAMKSTEPH